MNQQNLNSASLSKRQLIFLKTIDQRLEGLRRENERLLRIASNPRVVFSRSSLAGLYRIVNSLVSAGPMYGLTTIEQWAKTSRDWLVALGKRGSGPTEEELQWLLNTIAELGRLRDEAVIELEKKFKDGKDAGVSIPAVKEVVNNTEPATSAADELEIESEPARAADDAGGAANAEFDHISIFERKTDTEKVPPPILEEFEFPFMDEPKAQSIKESGFSSKFDKENTPVNQRLLQKEPRHMRDRTSTIPLAIDDLSMLGTTSKIPPGHSSKTGSSGRFWKVLAILSFIGFAVMTGLYVREVNRPQPTPQTPPNPAPVIAAHPTSPAPASPSGVALSVNQKDTKAVDTKAVDATVAPSALSKEDLGKTDDKGDTVDKGGDGNKDKKKVSLSEKIEKRDKDREKEHDPGKSSSSSSKSKSSDKVDNSTTDDMGILYVKAPDDGSAVVVLVDGTSKGKAPVKTRLSPGLHEVVFTADGKRSMRMVPIKADNTKTVVAVKPN